MSQELLAKNIITGTKLCLKSGTPITVAIQRLAATGAQSAYICNDDSMLLGIFTEKEALRAYTNGLYFDEVTGVVNDSMTTDVVSVNAEMPISKIALLFVENSFYQMPVLQDGKIVGEIQRSNLLQAITKHESGKQSSADSNQPAMIGAWEHKVASTEGSALPHGFGGDKK